MNKLIINTLKENVQYISLIKNIEDIQIIPYSNRCIITFNKISKKDIKNLLKQFKFEFNHQIKSL